MGFGVEDVRDLGPSLARDADIVQYALRASKVVVTRDLDFGEVLRYPTHPGAVILRLPPTTRAEQVTATLRAFLDQAKETEIRQAITIIEPGRIRRRRLS